MTNEAYVKDGVVRWRSNDAVPPAECLDQLAAEGLVFDRRKTDVARESDLRAFAAQYRKARARRTPEQREEEAAEMRAAFGPGAVVVDVLTGERFRT